MAKTRNPNSVRSARGILAAVAIGAFLIVDGLLVAAALSNGASTPQSTATPLSSNLLSTPGGEPDAVDLPPATRLLAAFDATSAWRSETGTCPKADALVEHSADGGKTWDGFDLGAQGGISAAVSLSALGDSRSAFVIAQTKQDCSPTWVGTTTEGTQWTAFPDRVATVWRIEPGNRAIVVSPAGVRKAPCPEVVGLAAVNATSAAALCSDGSLHRTTDTGVTWEASTPVRSAAAIGTGTDGYLVAALSDDPACVGVVVSAIAATGPADPTTVSRCVATGNESTDIAISGNSTATWLWAGATVVRSLDGGSTWK